VSESPTTHDLPQLRAWVRLTGIRDAPGGEPGKANLRRADLAHMPRFRCDWGQRKNTPTALGQYVNYRFAEITPYAVRSGVVIGWIKAQRA